MGFHLQTGWNASRRIFYGFDESVQSGSTALTAGLPRGCVLSLPIDATTQTFTAGWNHPFTNILAKGSFSCRFSVGPAFHFGRIVPSPRQKS